MSESLSQTLALLATFNIALISITIAVYALSASYLGRETRLSRRRMEERKIKLANKLRDLTKDVQITSLKEEIKKAENDISSLNNRLFLLSWLGAVIVPTIFFSVSFISAVLGMNSGILSSGSQNQDGLERQFIILSSGTLVLGFLLLFGVIGVIDSTVRNVPVPEFDVSFRGIGNSLAAKRTESKIGTIYISNIGEDVAEAVEVYVVVPASVMMEAQSGLHVSILPSGDRNGMFEIGTLHAGRNYAMPISFTAPDKKGTYSVSVIVCERKTCESRHQLSIEVSE